MDKDIVVKERKWFLKLQYQAILQENMPNLSGDNWAAGYRVAQERAANHVLGIVRAYPMTDAVTDWQITREVLYPATDGSRELDKQWGIKVIM